MYLYITILKDYILYILYYIYTLKSIDHNIKRNGLSPYEEMDSRQEVTATKSNYFLAINKFT